jgi:putative serine protease PepD
MDSSASSRARQWLRHGVALLAIAAAASGCTGGIVTRAPSRSPLPGPSAGSAAAPLQTAYEQVIKAVLPSVVEINTSNSTGSGVVYDSKGDIVTNAHVVGDAKTVQVLPASGSATLTAKVIGVFKPDDLAVIRVTSDADKLKPAKFGNSDDAQVGQIVMAMGNPLGLFDSVTQGIVSATGRTVSAAEQGGQALITAAIQTSAAINPGNSGGALVNLDEQVIGIPTLAARLPESGGAAPGIGFAIPSNTVRNIASQIIATGKVTHSDRAALDAAVETAANKEGQPAGVAVVSVDKGGAAAKAGLKSGDVIVSVDGIGTPNAQSLLDQISRLKPGDKVTLAVRSGHTTRNVTATLGSLSS